MNVQQKWQGDNAKWKVVQQQVQQQQIQHNASDFPDFSLILSFSFCCFVVVFLFLQFSIFCSGYTHVATFSQQPPLPRFTPLAFLFTHQLLPPLTVLLSPPTLLHPSARSLAHMHHLRLLAMCCTLGFVACSRFFATNFSLCYRKFLFHSFPLICA